MTSADEIVPNEHVVFTEFDEGEGILVDLNTKKYFQLNETAVIVWRGLEKNQPHEGIVAEIVKTYNISDAHANESVLKLLEKLRAFKLIRMR